MNWGGWTTLGRLVEACGAGLCAGLGEIPAASAGMTELWTHARLALPVALPLAQAVDATGGAEELGIVSMTGYVLGDV